MDKNAQGISINVIIIAVISLLVLVVLIMIFSGQIGNWSDEVENSSSDTCANQDVGYQIIQSGRPCPDGYMHSIYNYDDVEPGYKCCRADRTVQ